MEQAAAHVVNPSALQHATATAVVFAKEARSAYEEDDLHRFDDGEGDTIGDGPREHHVVCGALLELEPVDERGKER